MVMPRMNMAKPKKYSTCKRLNIVSRFQARPRPPLSAPKQCDARKALCTLRDCDPSGFTILSARYIVSTQLPLVQAPWPR